MAVNPLNLCADLQAWHSAGLSFIFLDKDGLDAEALLRAPAEFAKARAGRLSTASTGNLRAGASLAETFSDSSDASLLANQAMPVADAGQAAAFNSNQDISNAQQQSLVNDIPVNASPLDQRDNLHRAGAKPVNSPGAGPQAGNIAENHQKYGLENSANSWAHESSAQIRQSKSASFTSAVTPEQLQQPLPPSWQALAQKLKPAPVIWTYLELGQDLMVKGDPARSKALKELIGSLGLRAGTSAFLPVTLPGEAQDGSNAWCVEKIFNSLAGRILISLGSEALALGPYGHLNLTQFQEKIVQGRIILCLPAFSAILASPDLFEATKVFLRSAFAKINIM